MWEMCSWQDQPEPWTSPAPGAPFCWELLKMPCGSGQADLELGCCSSSTQPGLLSSRHTLGTQC